MKNLQAIALGITGIALAVVPMSANSAPNADLLQEAAGFRAQTECSIDRFGYNNQQVALKVSLWTGNDPDRVAAYRHRDTQKMAAMIRPAFNNDCTAMDFDNPSLQRALQYGSRL